MSLAPAKLLVPTYIRQRNFEILAYDLRRAQRRRSYITYATLIDTFLCERLGPTATSSTTLQRTGFQGPLAFNKMLQLTHANASEVSSA